MEITRSFTWHQCIEAFRGVLRRGTSSFQVFSRHFSFSGDSVFLLAALLLTNYLRIYFPGLVTDSLFGVVVLLLGVTLFRDRVPATARTPFFCFAALLGVYAVGLVTEFSFQGVRHLAGILLAGIIYLFCYRNGPAFARSRQMMFLLLIAMLALFPLYLVPGNFEPHTFSSILGYLLLIVGFILVAHFKNWKGQHGWVHVILVLVIVNGVVFGNRSLVLAVLLAYLLYWGGYLFLRSRAGAGALAVISGGLIFFMTAFLASSHFSGTLLDLDSFARKYTGEGILSGRDVIWRKTLTHISEAPWFGKGPGAVISSLRKDSDSSFIPEDSVLASSCAEGGPGLIADCAILMGARDTLAGDSDAPLWVWWDPIRPIHLWRGVKVGGTPPRVTALNLQGMGLEGRIPPELGELGELQYLVLAGNKFSGPIPPALYAVDDHDLYRDLFCRPLPGVPAGLLADCDTLLAVQASLVDDGALDWGRSVPVGLWRGVGVGGVPPRVTRLDLQGISLEGRIPPELGELGELRQLVLAHNTLTGPIPPELGQLLKLEELWLRENRLSGSIPPELGELEKLSVLRLAGNRFSGPIPPALYAVDDHDLYHDLLCRPLPGVPAGLLADCDTLLAVQASLVGDGVLNWGRSVPIGLWRGVEVGGMPPRVTGLNLRRVGLEGHIPPELGELGELRYLVLADNTLTGSIPPELGRLEHLVSLRLYRNWLTGSIPLELGELGELRKLVLADNTLTGPIPPELGRLLNLEELWLRGNALSGSIPPELGELEKLSVLRLAGNRFSDPIPPALYTVDNHDLYRDLPCRPLPRVSAGLLADCATLLGARAALAGNSDAPLWTWWNLDKPIHLWRGVEVGGTPPRVTALDLQGMGLEGRIPPELGELDRLSVLRLAGNRFSGSIPPALYAVNDRDFYHDLPCLPLPEVPAGLLADCNTLLAVQASLVDDGVLNWGRSVPVGLWRGVEVGGVPPRVTGLHLWRVGLEGHIPPELGELEHLVSLYLHQNRLTGSIPPELGELGELRHLVLAYNTLTGSIPPELGRLLNLEELWLKENRLSGSIPPELGELDRLSVLRLAGNKFSGSIPPELGELGELRQLILTGNILTGSIPPELGQLEHLVSLYLNRNQLTGSIPPELGELGELRHLVLAYNTLTGSIPPELGRLLKLEELWLKENRLSGSIPSELGELDRLSVLRLAGNRFSDSIPPALYAVDDHDLYRDLPCRPLPGVPAGLLADCDTLLAVQASLVDDGVLNWGRSVPVGLWRGVEVGGVPPRVTGLHLWRVGLEGHIPPELGELEHLVSLYLHQNRLTGSIPPELGELGELRHLVLAYNTLTGSIPPELGRLLNLEELWLKENRLSGSIPPELGELDRLSVLRLAGNKFSGSIPPALYAVDDHDLYRDLPCRPLPGVPAGLLADCDTLLAVQDSLIGDDGVLNWGRSVPVGLWQGVEVGGVPLRVTGLNLRGVGLEGRIPPELGELGELRYLVLADNTLTGSIPPELGQLEHLVSLRLNRNWLTGSIPLELGELGKLQHLVLAHNTLTGPIPPELGQLLNLEELWLRENRLSGSIPSELGELDRLSVLRLAGNRFSDSIPPALYAVDDHDLYRDLPCRPLPGVPAGLLADCDTLLAVQASLVDDDVLNWGRSVPIGLWHGVEAGGVPPRVTELDLRGVDLEGRIPPELGRLEKLSVLRLAGNKFSGSIPPALYEVADHDLYHDLPCRPSPGVPAGLLADCDTLLAVQASLVDDGVLNWGRSVPVELWQGVEVGGVPPRVTGLNLQGVGLEGRIPPELGRLEHLVSLRLNRNRLTGSIPPELGRLLNLEELWLKENRLNGSIPPELGELEKLSVLRLAGNRFSGPISPALYAVDDHDLDILLQKGGAAGHRFRTLNDLPYLSDDVQNPGLGGFSTAIMKINAFVDPSTYGSGIPKSSHNLFLQTGLQTGVVGIIALGLLCVSLVFNLCARTGEGVGPVRCFAAACTLMVIFHNVFEVFMLQNVFSIAVIEWILIGVVAGVVNHGQAPASGMHIFRREKPIQFS